MTTDGFGEHHVQGARAKHRAVTVMTVAAMLLAAPPWAAANIGGGPTGCYHLCPDRWVDYLNGVGSGPCYVEGTVAVQPGSLIDCDALDVVVRSNEGGNLTIEDGTFTLRAHDLTVQGAAITATCTSAVEIGYTLTLDGSVSLGTGAILGASCDYGGGSIVIDAPDGVTSTTDQDIQAVGTGVDASGGRIAIRSDQDVSITGAMQVRAHSDQSTQTEAEGGSVEIDGDDVTVPKIDVRGKNAEGGLVEIEAEGNLTLSGEVVAEGSGGDGGGITLEADGSITATKDLRAKGGDAQAEGGSIDIRGSAVSIAGDVRTDGGVGGGEISIEAGAGPVTIGTTSLSRVTATRTSNHPGDGGQITIRSAGSDVTIGGSALVDASGAGSDGYGGAIVIEGVNLDIDSAADIKADASPAGVGGNIAIGWRDLLYGSTAGLSATNGGSISLSHRQPDGSECAAGAVCSCPTGSTCEKDQATNLADPCGDGYRRHDGLGPSPEEACDGNDLAGYVCSTVPGGSFTDGTLACAGDCVFDTSRCTP